MAENPLARRRWTFRERQEIRRPIPEEITPDSGWTAEPDLHTLLIDLPGFKEGDIKLRIDKPGSISVSGERVTPDNKHVHFEKTFNLPEDAEVDKITMQFQGEVLKVLVPRMKKEKGEPEIKEEPEREPAEEKKEEPEMPKEERETPKEKQEMPKDEKEKPEEEEDSQKTEGKEKEEESSRVQEESRHERREETARKSVIGKICETKGILLASIISFTLGYLLSRKYQPPPPSRS